MTATTTTNTPDGVHFATSESNVVAMLTRVRGMVPVKLRELGAKEKQMEYDNAPRIVGAMKMAMDITVAFTGSPWFIAYAAFAVTGRMISIIYGSKKHQKKLAEEKAQGKHQKLPDESWQGNIRKIFHPREYPVEASAGLSVIAETFGVGYGVAREMSRLPGITPILTGLIAVWSYGNILFKKEKKKLDSSDQQHAPAKDNPSEPLVFAKSESKPVGITGRIRQYLKGSPVLVSSMVNVTICMGMLIGGLIEAQPAAYVIAAGVGAIANLTQGLLVRKHEFNVEGAGADTPPQEPSHRERLAERRDRDNNPGLQPA